jgi:hypothetical protein
MEITISLTKSEMVDIIFDFLREKFTKKTEVGLLFDFKEKKETFDYELKDINFIKYDTTTLDIVDVVGMEIKIKELKK